MLYPMQPSTLYGCKKDSVLYGDNQGTLKLIKSQKINDLTKHVAIKYHHVRNLVLEQGCFDLEYLPTSDNLADIGTKSIARAQFEKLRLLVLQHD